MKKRRMITDCHAWMDKSISDSYRVESYGPSLSDAME